MNAQTKIRTPITDTRELRAFLVEQIQGVAEGKVNSEKAKGICNISQQIYNTLNVEVKMAQARSKLKEGEVVQPCQLYRLTSPRRELQACADAVEAMRKRGDVSRRRMALVENGSDAEIIAAAQAEYINYVPVTLAETYGETAYCYRDRDIWFGTVTTHPRRPLSCAGHGLVLSAVIASRPHTTRRRVTPLRHSGDTFGCAA